MASKKPTYPTAEPIVRAYEGHERLESSTSVSELLKIRYATAEKIRTTLAKASSKEEKRALKLAHEIVYNEIYTLAELERALTLLEKPHVAAWVALEDRVTELTKEINEIKYCR